MPKPPKPMTLVEHLRAKGCTECRGLRDEAADRIEALEAAIRKHVGDNLGGDEDLVEVLNAENTASGPRSESGQ